VRPSRVLLPLLIALLAPVVAMAQSVAPIREGDRALGSADAPATLTVYLSAVCPHCADWHGDEFAEIRRRHVDTGQLRVVFRELPTEPADEAYAGAVLARCAAEDRYDDVMTSLFENSMVWRSGDVGGWLRAAAAAGGVSDARATECFADETRWTEISTRSEQALAEGVTGTPAFFLNGEPVPYAAGRDAAAFEALLKPLLGQ
jgi:protein-disulfide isomerase